MTTFKEACAELAADEGVYCLYLPDGQAQAVLRALEAASESDGDAREARERLQRLLDQCTAPAETGDARRALRPV